MNARSSLHTIAYDVLNSSYFQEQRIATLIKTN